MIHTEQLAMQGGPKAIQRDPGDIFDWPIITAEDEAAVLDVLRNKKMSGTDITVQFEKEFAAWQGTKYALGFNNGTAALHAAMYGCGVGVGDEIISPSLTYWASILPCFSLGATMVFAEVEPNSMCIDPKDIEHRITNRTKAILVVHYMGHPTDMDPIMEIAHKHNLKVIEDVSHAHGALYKGRKVGSIGHVGAMSMMSGKSFAVGEAGMLVTNDREIVDKGISLGLYERGGEVVTESLRPFIAVPMGGYKYRMHQMSSAVGRVQLKHYDARIAEIQKAMNYFWDQLEGVPGIRAHRPAKDSGSTMGGWYAAHGLYVPEELGGLSVTQFAKALDAEGFVEGGPGCNLPLHLHSVFNTCDVYGHGKPTRIANSDRDLRQPAGSLPVTEGIGKRTYCIPWFKHYRPEIIDEYVNAFRKVSENYKDLLASDPGNAPRLGGWHFFSHSAENDEA
jgi:dTDP-4-amino-4,6-dideoxygalactose transaminase